MKNDIFISLYDYIYIVSKTAGGNVFFTNIRESQHYKEFHEANVPWSEVVTVILQSSKQIRKKGERIEIETEKYYILCELKDNILWVINAKRK